ncbi:ABC transporter permease [Micromonospora sp. WMMD882]|uniref:ABC transporter permease n=1 Tax=Micromonospora sp. WMMD882 TaxID=3015151 RepID=UPI00248B99B4|nr:ABC transporter permease [Micromonospora sp. WMMD882]WBB80818.1 ABC transporter permease [Micromonospora sp. WMMD882]
MSAAARRSRAGALGRRVRATAGPTLLLAVLALVAAALVTAAPRLAHGHADRALRADLAALPYQVRDVTVAARSGPTDPAPPSDALERIGAALPGPLPGLVGQRWQAVAVDAEQAVAGGDVGPLGEGARVQFGLRAQTGLPAAARLTAGAWPRTAAGQPAQIAVSGPVADTLGLRPGVRLTVGAPGRARADLIVSGVFTPTSDPDWEPMPQAREPLLPVGDNDPFVAVAVTDPAGMTQVATTAGLPVTRTWRYRLDTDRIEASSAQELATAVGVARRTAWLPAATVQTSLDTTLVGFDARLASARTLLAMVQAGLLASLLGLILLAARVTVRTRHAELALLRSRGASLPDLARWTLTEALLLHPAAVAAGWLAGRLAPGRDDPATLWALPTLAVATTVAVPLFAVAGHRRVTVVTARADQRRRRTAWRLTVEAGVWGAAALGVALLRRRGVDDGPVDVYLAAVPTLVAVAVAALTLRVTPAAVRLLDRAAARTRGPLLLLGAARAGRGGVSAATGPLAVLVVAVGTGVFSAVAADTVTRARDTAADLSVPADAWLTGYAFDADTGGRLAALPGVRAVAPARVESNRPLLTGVDPRAEPVTTARVLVVDGPAFARVVAGSGVDVDVPAALAAAAARGDGPVPAVVSPPVAAAVAAGATAADVQGRLYAFTPAAVVDTFPGVDLDAERFVVLPWQALVESPDTPIVANRYLLAVDDVDRAALLRLADDGQRRWLSSVRGDPVGVPELPARLLTRHEHRQALDRTGVNDVLTLTFTVGAVGGSLLALLAVGFAVLADSRSRTLLLSRLSALGLSAGQGRRLLVYEVAPLVGATAVAGAAVGVVLPLLVGPALGLSAFTSGVSAGWRLDPLVVAAVLAVVAVGVAAGVAVEILVSRRARPGGTPRRGEENL